MDTSRSYLEPSSFSKKMAAAIIIVYAVITLIPISWMVMTSFKNVDSAISYPPEVLFEPSLEGYVNLFTKNWYEELVRSREMVITGPSKFLGRYSNSMIIGFGSTFASVFLGALAAYAFSRFRVPLKDDLLFFILSTRMFPPIAVAVPIFIMYRKLGLGDTHLGMIILYTVVNLSLAVWLLKGFMDEIPKEYEEAAMIDGYSRLQAFFKVVLPQAMTGIAATAIFCMIFSWNEYAFAVLLTQFNAQTAPPFIPTIIGEGGLDWPAIGAGTTLFLLPVMIFTIILRKHLLRGITFGAVRK